MWKRVLDSLLPKNKNRQHFKIGTTDGYYYQIELDQHPKIIDLPNLTYSFTEAILAYTQKHKADEHQFLVNFIKQLANDGFSARHIKQYLQKNFAFEPWVTLNTVQDKYLEGSFDSQANKFSLKKPGVLFKYQYLFSVASLLYYSVQQMNENQITDFDKKFNQGLHNIPYLLVNTG